MQTKGPRSSDDMPSHLLHEVSVHVEGAQQGQQVIEVHVAPLVDHKVAGPKATSVHLPHRGAAQQQLLQHLGWQGPLGLAIAQYHLLDGTGLNGVPLRQHAALNEALQQLHGDLQGEAQGLSGHEGTQPMHSQESASSGWAQIAPLVGRYAHLRTWFLKTGSMLRSSTEHRGCSCSTLCIDLDTSSQARTLSLNGTALNTVSKASRGSA